MMATRGKTRETLTFYLLLSHREMLMKLYRNKEEKMQKC
jgi:hypothetical protein